MAGEENVIDLESTISGGACAICKKDATKYCIVCPEIMCDECAILHTTQKLSKGHTITDITDMAANTCQDKTELCEPCQERNKSLEARAFCSECEEKLCYNCTEVHKAQKITKSHALIPISEYQKSANVVLCDPCIQENLEENANVYCAECEENLCTKCENQHKVRKATRGHELVDLKMKGLTSKGSSSPKITLRCEPCHDIGKETQAKTVCKECKEGLCTRCSSSHLKRKATKSHTLFDVDLIPPRFCDSCTDRGSQTNAVNECMVCDECFCEFCSESHKRRKATKHHELNSITLPNLQECDVCMEDDKIAFAIEYCQECKEYVCTDCGKAHGRRRATKKHILVNATKANDDVLSDSVDSETTVNEQKKNTGHQVEEEEHTQYVQEKRQTQDDLRPGKPFSKDVLSDSVILQWVKPNVIESESSIAYQLRYREKDTKKWTFYIDQPTIGYVVINGLKSQCTYIFQVRAIVDDTEGPYSDQSEEVETRPSLASKLLPFTTKNKDGSPSIHKLNSTENLAARDKGAKTRKFDLGKAPILKEQEKTILLVGATGSGKSTLVDGIINYVTGVNWKDPFRFTLVDLEKDEQNKNQAVSQTEWITCYSINPEEGSRLNYRLNIIDTPGFGDTRGLERDNQIVDQLRNLFSSKGQKGVVFIDAVCFVIKAPDARLTAVQKYVFMSILSLFGQDIADNICTLITFADGDKPPVLAALQEANLPFKAWYPFNNSGLFAGNVGDESSLAPIFWEMGIKSFKRFFDCLTQLSTKSLQQTKEVLIERQRLETTICQLQPEVDAGLSKVNELKQEIYILTQNEQKISDNKDFEYEVEETKIVRTELPPRTYVTNCITCNRTCHEWCGIPNDADKKGCAAMGRDGNCTVCPGHCFWNKHCNNPYKFTFVAEKVKKTYNEKLKQYQEAGKKKLTHEQVIEKMEDELEYLGQTISDMMDIINKCNNTLKDIALHPHPLSMVEHIDLMIESEKMEKKHGFNDRIRVLQAYRKRADIHKDVDKLKQEYKAAGRAPTTKKRKGFFASIFNWQ